MAWTRRTAKVVSLVIVVVLSVSGVAMAGPNPARDPTVVRLSHVVPRLAAAASDKPGIAHARCNARYRDDARLCRLGDRRSQKVMVAFGDSHMVQWFSAIRRTALRSHYRLLWATKPGCPAAAVPVLSGQTGRPFTDCWKWRKSLFDRLRALPRIDVAVMASSSWHSLLVPGTQTVISDPSERERAWHAGMVKSIRALKGVARTVLVIRDTPRLWIDAASCLQSSGGNTRPCSRARSQTLLPGIWAVEKGLVKQFRRVRAVQFTSSFCTHTMCRPVTHGLVLRYRDDNHVSNTFARTMSTTVAARVRAILR